MRTGETCLAARQTMSRMRARIDNDAALKLTLEGMIAAATHPDAEVRFAFEMFTGEDGCWSINAQDAFARFCPCYGQALPNQAFEPEPIA